MEAVTETLVSAGPLGAIIAVLGVAYFRQGRALGDALKEAQQARVDDAKKVTGDLLQLNEKWLVAINSLTGAVNDIRSQSRRGP